MTRKTCIHCKAVKPLDSFRAAERTLDGHRNVCRACQSAREKENKTGKPRPPTTPDERMAALLARAHNALTTGMWRGPEAIRAYRELREAFEWYALAEDVDEEDAIDHTARPCSCGILSPCPRHAEEVAAA
jgi:hypothetical protein